MWTRCKCRCSIVKASGSRSEASDLIDLLSDVSSMRMRAALAGSVLLGASARAGASCTISGELSGQMGRHGGSVEQLSQECVCPNASLARRAFQLVATSRCLLNSGIAYQCGHLAHRPRATADRIPISAIGTAGERKEAVLASKPIRERPNAICRVFILGAGRVHVAASQARSYDVECSLYFDHTAVDDLLVNMVEVNGKLGGFHSRCDMPRACPVQAARVRLASSA
jgi:hypothetical protein